MQREGLRERGKESFEQTHAWLGSPKSGLNLTQSQGSISWSRDQNLSRNQEWDANWLCQAGALVFNFYWYLEIHVCFKKLLPKSCLRCAYSLLRYLFPFNVEPKSDVPTAFKYNLLLSDKNSSLRRYFNSWGAWVAQSAKCLPSVQVLLPGFWDPAKHWAPCWVGSVLLPLPGLCALSLCLR